MDREIRTDGVSLRIWRSSDLSALAAILGASREAFEAWLPNAVRDLADLPVFLAHAESSYRDGSGFFYAIEEDGQPVGQCSINRHSDGIAEIGYWVRTDRTGQGLATRAVLAVTDAAFAEGFTGLVIHCDEGNFRSAAVAQRAGFVHLKTVDLDPTLPRTSAQTGREMTWVLLKPAE